MPTTTGTSPARTGALLVLAALVTGCSDYDIIRYEGVDVFNQNPAEEVDVLLVVDNSGSMEPYQEQLGASFDQFMTYFVQANVDYHIGVVTTDIEARDAGEIRGQIVTPDTESAPEVFDQIVHVGTTGSGFEMGLEAASMALTEPLISSANIGFLREEASLSLIFVSDEEDSSPWPVNDYINEFRDVKGQRSRDVFNASALVVTDVETCSGDARFWSVPGTRYIDVAEQTRGVIGNLCATDFEQIVTDLSLNTTRLQDTFYLSDWPDTATIDVSVDEEPIDCSSGEWTYQVLPLEGTDTPAIVFDRDHLPPISSRIAVRYDYGEGDPSRFCTDDEIQDTGSAGEEE